MPSPSPANFAGTKPTGATATQPVGDPNARALQGRIWVLIWRLTASLLLGGLLAGAIAAAAVWSDLQGVVFAAAWSTIGVALGIAVGVILLFVLAGVSSANIAFGVVGAGMARMMSSLAFALVIYFTVKPEGKTFWAVFLACNLLSLIVESAWGISACRSQDAPSSSSPSSSSPSPPSSSSPLPTAHSLLPSSSPLPIAHSPLPISQGSVS